MNTIIVYQAIAHNPGLTLRELAALLNMPLSSVRRAKDSLAKLGQIEPCGTVKNHVSAYKWKTTAT